MKVQYACHCSYRIRYHMVFVIKYRKAMIDEAIFEHFKTIFKGIAERYYYRQARENVGRNQETRYQGYRTFAGLQSAAEAVDKNQETMDQKREDTA